MLRDIDRVLRAEDRYATTAASVPWRGLLLLLGAAGFLYGGFMGSYAGLRPQIAISAVKVPLLLLSASALCLPSFFVLNTLLGLRDDFAASLRGVFATQTTLALCLASFAPVTALAYLSGLSYPGAKLLNGVLFAVASYAAQITLRRHYRPLIAKNSRHRIGLTLWLVLYVFVAIQLAWVLRPFVGAPDLPAAFFREDAWGNAYVELWQTFLRFVAR